MSLTGPIGSGAVESAIRRVINQRLKGPCIFWNKENAEKIITLRAYRKAGRWNLLKNTVNVQIALLAPYPKKGLAPVSSLGVWLLRPGIELIHGCPYHPQTQGKEERFHRTLKVELLSRTTA